MSKIFFLLIFLVNLFYSDSTAALIPTETGYSDLNLSPSGRYLTYSFDKQPGIFLLDIKKNESILISSGNGCAYQSSWSPDERFLGFKIFKKSDGYIMQIPALYDIEKKEIIELSSPVLQAGVPSFSGNDLVVFTLSNFLMIKDMKTSTFTRVDLYHYSNLTPISKDGSKVIFNDAEDQLWILELATLKKMKLTHSLKGYYEPVWSPEGNLIVASTWGGELNIIRIIDQSVTNIGAGNNPEWINDGQGLVFSRPEISYDNELINLDLFSVDKFGENLRQVTNSTEWEAFPAATSDVSRIFMADRLSGTIIFVSNEQKTESLNLNAAHYRVINIHSKITQSEIMYENFSNDNNLSPDALFFDIPYVHQRYDTPDWFDGNWACGATSASMCLAYYGLITPWPVTVSTPYSHVSDYGNYICEIYTVNNYTFNIWANDPQGNKGYGGYGFIVRNGSQAWADTKGYMAEYARKHGLESSVDWSPTRLKLMNEADSKRPFVLLNSLTTAGHYISVIGYENEGTSVIVNDPYGDKNRGYANFYGRRAIYDWPGYSNGHSNLNTVHCYIYFRGEVFGYSDLAVESLQVQDSCDIGETIPFSAKVFNLGDTLSSACILKYVLSSDQTFSEDDIIFSSDSLPVLGTGDSLLITKDLELPDSMNSARLYIGAVADAHKENREVMRDNNFGTSEIIVRGYPEIYYVYPEEDAIISTTDKPEINVKYKELIGILDIQTFQLILDGIDITDSCDINIRRALFLPGIGLSEGTHSLSASVSNRFGYKISKSWQFAIDLQTGMENPLQTIQHLMLQQNYPNPFNPVTAISYTVPEFELVVLEIYNILGEKVADLVHSKQPQGFYTVKWNAENYPSGIYFCKMSIGNNTKLIKMVLQK